MPEGALMSTAKSDTVTSVPVVPGRRLSVRRLLLGLLVLEAIGYLSFRIGAAVLLGLLALAVAALSIWLFIRWTRKRFRFSLRAHLAITAVFAVLFADQ